MHVLSKHFMHDFKYRIPDMHNANNNYTVQYLWLHIADKVTKCTDKVFYIPRRLSMCFILVDSVNMERTIVTIFLLAVGALGAFREER